MKQTFESLVFYLFRFTLLLWSWRGVGDAVGVNVMQDQPCNCTTQSAPPFFRWHHLSFLLGDKLACWSNWQREWPGRSFNASSDAPIEWYFDISSVRLIPIFGPWLSVSPNCDACFGQFRISDFSFQVRVPCFHTVQLTNCTHHCVSSFSWYFVCLSPMLPFSPPFLGLTIPGGVAGGFGVGPLPMTPVGAAETGPQHSSV